MDTIYVFTSWVKNNFDPVEKPYAKNGHTFTMIDGIHYGPINMEGAAEFFSQLPPDEAVEFMDLLEKGIDKEV